MTETPASNPRDSERQQRLRHRVAHCLELLEEGGEDAVEAFLAEHADDAPMIRARLARLANAGLLTDSSGGVPERLGDFRLLEPLGFGGMGIVYRAVQESLQREVALKLVRPDQLWFEGTRVRFQREVETIARLQHPGIVAIHAVGEERAVPYFAMERLRGATLAELLHALRGETFARLTGEVVQRQLVALAKDTPLTESCRALLTGSWTRVACRITWHVATTLAFTHQHGILHRDVKPNNVFLTVEGRVVLLDFGLSSHVGAAHLTRTGSPVGSLPYMAPETLERGREGISPKVDVYGLGVTLYELLTGRSPFLDQSTQLTMRRILAGDCAKPARFNRSIPWDVQTVCAVAMERDPARRYETAHAFAEDLEALLAARAIRARRAGPVQLAKRFARRHPARATALSLFAVAALVLPSVDAAQQRAVAHTLESALHRTTLERDRATRHAGIALTAVKEMLLRLGDDGLANVPGMDGLRRTCIERARDLCAELVTLEQREPEMLVAWATARTAIGSLLHQLGEHETAVATLEETIAFLVARCGEVPANPRLALSLAGVQLERGNLAYATRDLERAEREWCVARGLLESIVANPEDHDARTAADNLASCMTNLAALHAARRRTTEAAEAYEEAIALRERLVASAPENLLAHRHLGIAWNGLGMLRSTRPGADDVEPAFAAADASFEHALALDPRDARTLFERAFSWHSRAKWNLRQGRAAQARVLLDEARVALDELITEHPARLEYQAARCDVLGSLIGMAFGAGAYEEGVSLAREELEQREALAAKDPSNVQWVEPLGFALGRLGIHAYRANDVELAQECWEREEAHWKRVLERDPDSVRAHYGLALNYGNRQTPAHRAADWPRLTELLEGTIHHRRRLLELAPHVADTRTKLAHDVVVLAVRRLLDGFPDDAMRWLTWGVEEAGVTRAQLETNTDLRPLHDREDFRRLLERTRE